MNSHNVFLERKLWTKYSLIAGIDEAGRGSLAGPVVVAGVILKQNFFHPLIKDSKKLSPKNRIIAEKIILENSVVCQIVKIGKQKIDHINIKKATQLGMRKIISKIKPKPNLILIDWEKITNKKFVIMSFSHGEDKSINIAAASIIAKVFRDRLMCKYALKFRDFSFSKHKGYGTKLHFEEIRKHGLSSIHRKTFTKNVAIEK